MALIKGKQLGTGANGVDTPNLKDSAVTSTKIASGAIDNANKFAAGVVDATALASSSVTSAKIATGAIDNANKFAAGVVDSTALADASVTSAKLGANSVTSSAIASGSIDNANKFAAGVVDATALASSSVTSAKIATGAIDNANKFAAGVVDATALASSSVTSAKIATGAIDNANKFGAGVVGTTALAANAVTSAKVDSSVLIASGTNPLTGSLSAGGFKITNLNTPTADGDAANKAYVDLYAQGLTDFKQSCRVATTANLSATFNAGANTLVATSNGALSIDGVSLASGNRVLVKDQGGGASSLQNGIYTVTSAGSAGSPWGLTRSTDADTSAEVTSGMYTYVSEGSTNGGNSYVLSTPDPIVLNTTALSFVQFSGAGQVVAGAGLSKTGNTLDVNVDGTTIEISSDALRIAASAAGAGLTGGGGSALAVGAGAGISVGADSVAVVYGSGTDISTAAAGAAKSAGSLDSAARSDHAHAFPTAAAVNVGTSNAEGSSSSFARADHVHAAPGQSSANKGMAASATNADGQEACATGLSNTPALASYVEVSVNGIQYTVGNGVKTKDCYFSSDAGSTAKATNALASGDKLYWNGSIAGFQLAIDDTIDFNYPAF